MDKRVHELLNQQINKEFYSAYLYLEFSNYFEDRGLDGFANWYMIQAQEERDHAMLFYRYLQNENEKVTLEAIDKPTVTINEDMDVLKAGLKHEKYVTVLTGKEVSVRFDRPTALQIDGETHLNITEYSARVHSAVPSCTE